MFVYFALLIVYGFASIGRLGDYRMNRKIAVILAMLPMVILVGFRGLTVGSDTGNYYRTFTGIEWTSTLAEAFSRSRMEVGFVLYNYVLSHIGLDYLGFQVVSAVLVYTSLGVFLYRYSPNIWQSAFAFLSMRMMFGSMTTARAWIAVAIILWAIPALMKRRILPFVLLVAIAATFHFTALVFLAAYPLTSPKLKKVDFRWVWVICALVAIAGVSFFAPILRMINRYESYLEGEYFVSENHTAAMLTLGIDLCFFIMWRLTMGRQLKVFETESIWAMDMTHITYIMIVVAVGFDIIGLSNNIMNRVSMFYRPFWLLAIPESFGAIRKGKNALFLKVIVMLLLALQMWVVLKYRPGWNQAVPYVFYKN